MRYVLNGKIEKSIDSFMYNKRWTSKKENTKALDKWQTEKRDNTE